MRIIKSLLIAIIFFIQPIESGVETIYLNNFQPCGDVITAKHIPPTPIPDEPKKIILEDPKYLELPSISTEAKLFTDYRFLNLQWTPHYRLQQRAYTDSNGLRRFNDDYMVAMGSFYSTSIGDRFKVTLESGIEFTVILADAKWDSDCDERNMYMPYTNYNGETVGNLLEFIIDKDVLDYKIYAYGDLNIMDKFKGSITKLEYLGRDTSGDWDSYS